LHSKSVIGRTNWASFRKTTAIFKNNIVDLCKLKNQSDFLVILILLPVRQYFINSIRLIDGVVMRICDAIARQVAITKWNDIKEDLEEGSKVSIPLVLEQNHFEFEPSFTKCKVFTITTCVA
jgi:UDP-N-acetylglucosamine transferase subunit ALG13